MFKRKSETGRSMVEMLGVLAIIGVLSIGGIAGYTLSMRRHRANQVVDILNKYALIAYGICQLQVTNGEISSITECNNTVIPKMSEADVGTSNDIYYYRTDWFWPTISQKNGVDYVNLEVNFVDNEVCKAVKSTLGSMTSDYCEPDSRWLTVRIPQN